MDTFRVEPTQGLLEAHITHISDSKILLRVYFTAKYAQVLINKKVLECYHLQEDSTLSLAT